MSFYVRAGLVVAMLVALVGCAPPGSSLSPPSAPPVSAAEPSPEATVVPSPEVAPPSTAGVVREISPAAFERMKYVSWREGCPGRDELRFVEVPFKDFEGKTQTGTLVVHRSIAEEVGAIFEEIYAAGYPIQQIKPIEDIVDPDTQVTDSGAPATKLDDESMAANNTSAFNCRDLPGTANMSQHSLGLAIDINPLFNPMVEKCVEKGVIYFERGCVINPPAGEEHIKRGTAAPVLWAGNPVVHIFKSHGWRWGGDWQTLRDDQHFDVKGRG